MFIPLVSFGQSQSNIETKQNNVKKALVELGLSDLNPYLGLIVFDIDDGYKKYSKRYKDLADYILTEFLKNTSKDKNFPDDYSRWFIESGESDKANNYIAFIKNIDNNKYSKWSKFTKAVTSITLYNEGKSSWLPYSASQVAKEEITRDEYYSEVQKNIQSVINYAKSKKLNELKQLTNQINENGKKTGLWKTYFDSGELETEEYWVDGKVNGTSKTYYKNGNLKMVSNAKNDMIDGSMKAYFENGTLRATGAFKENKRVGMWIEYNQNGEIIQEKVFSSDKEW